MRRVSSLANLRESDLRHDETFRQEATKSWQWYVRGTAKGLQVSLHRRAGWVERSGSEDITLPILWKALGWVDLCLRGFSQVYLQSNPVTGALLYAAVAVSLPLYGVLPLLSCITSSALSAFIADWSDVKSGLFGYDSVLVGCALETFFVAPETSSAQIGMLVFLAVMCGVFVSVARRCVGVASASCGVPAFTLAFNFVGLVVLYATHEQGASLTPAKNPPPFNPLSDQFSDPRFYVDTILLGVGQLTFVDTLVGAVICVVGLLFASIPVACLAVVGSVVGALTALGLGGGLVAGGPAHQWSVVLANCRLGLFGYNACAAAIVPFLKFLENGEATTRRRVLAVILGALTTAVASSLFTMSLMGAMSKPVLTLPFCVSSWMFWLAINVSDDEADSGALGGEGHHQLESPSPNGGPEELRRFMKNRSSPSVESPSGVKMFPPGSDSDVNQEETCRCGRVLAFDSNAPLDAAIEVGSGVDAPMNS